MKLNGYQIVNEAINPLKSLKDFILKHPQFVRKRVTNIGSKIIKSKKSKRKTTPEQD